MFPERFSACALEEKPRISTIPEALALHSTGQAGIPLQRDQIFRGFKFEPDLKTIFQNHGASAEIGQT